MKALRTTLMRFAVVGVCALAVSASLAPAAFAQEGPYGSTTTTTAPQRIATIELSIDSGPRGTQVGVSACGYAPGATPGSVSFDGAIVAEDLVANADGCLTTAAGASTGAPLTIRVPDDARSGQRNVCGVLAGYNTPCAKFQVRNNQDGDTQVQGVTIEKGSGGTPSSGGAVLFGGSLAKTGLALGLLVAVAAALIVGGRTLLAGSHRRRRTTAR